LVYVCVICSEDCDALWRANRRTREAARQLLYERCFARPDDVRLDVKPILSGVHLARLFHLAKRNKLTLDEAFAAIVTGFLQGKKRLDGC
jgi:hypothetical protein